jgi:hypothetical protein
MNFKRRTAQLCALLAIGGLSTGVSILLTQSGGASPSSTQTATTEPTLPEQIPIEGPNGYEGTVPNSVFTKPPPLTSSGALPSASEYPGASVVIGSYAGYAVTDNGVLTGYWVPGNQPTTFVTVAQAESEGAVPSDGASAVGTTTAVTPEQATPAAGP